MIYHYLFFLLEFLLLFLSNISRSRAPRVIALIFAIAFCGLRFETGYDYYSYRGFFENIESYEGLLEPGFYYLVSLGSSLGVSSTGFFFLFSLATHGIAYYTLTKVSEKPNMAFLIYLLTPGLYLNSFSILRSAIAVSIFVYATFRLMSDRSKLKYLQWCILASSFHFTAIIAFLVAIGLHLAPKRMPRMAVIIPLYLGSLVLSLLPVAQYILGMFGGKYVTYVEMVEPQSALKIIATSLISAYLIYHVKYFKRSEYQTYFFKIWLVGIILFNVFIQFGAVTRISYYFTFFAIPLLVFASNIHRGFIGSAHRVVIVIFFTAGLLVALYHDSQSTENPLNISNYKSVLDAP